MTATENIVNRKLKIRIGSKQLGADPGTKPCEFSPRLVIGNNGHCPSISSSGNKKLYAGENFKVKISTADSNKRGLPAMVGGQKEKRRKMDRSVTQKCSSILNQLMIHRYGWGFNRPVDPVELKIPDYFSIIRNPMDLGTIKTKLTSNVYSSVDEFAADVRLTFSNAMLYNPPGNSFHFMAKKLNDLFNSKWNAMETKWNGGGINMQQGSILSGSANSVDAQNNCDKNSLLRVTLPKRLISAGEKQKLRKQFLELLRGKVPSHLQSFLRKNGFDPLRRERIEVDVDAFDDEIFWELKKIISSLEARTEKVAPAKKTENGGQQSQGKITLKGTSSGNGSATCSNNDILPLNLVTSKCGSCCNMRCQCNKESDHAHASSDLSSERSLGQDHRNASRKECGVKLQSDSQLNKLELESEGAVSAVDEDHFSSSPQLLAMDTSTTTASEEGWTSVIDIQLSPKKALRAAMLKSRFADTIVKAKQKTLLDHGDASDRVKMQQEKERLERQQQEERARIEAQIKASLEAERMRAEAELKMVVEREREAARLALQQMVKTVEIDNDHEILKDLELLSGCSLSDQIGGCSSEEGPEVGSVKGGHHSGKALEQLGLFMKDDYIEDEDEEVLAILGGGGDGEEGEIFP